MADQSKQTCNVIIIGASGDLTRRKLIPALFSLYCNKQLPSDFNLIGFARSNMSDDEFRSLITENLTCRYVPGEKDCEDKINAFLASCHYVSGQYGDRDAFVALDEKIRTLGDGTGNNLFYMAIPPSIFVETARAIDEAGLMNHDSPDTWSRVVLEKPFGRDSASARELLDAMGALFEEEQTYRIDHYLGKEVIQNLLCLRFANLIFEPIWNHQYIRSVSISWSEKIGCEGRGGYFDSYGIIRDVVQNHLLQIMALVGMEQPVALDAEDIRDEKVKLLRCVQPVELRDLVIGQYTGIEIGETKVDGYLDDPGVPDDSITDTYAFAELKINNPRWAGVPFYVKAGKALDTQMTEIIIHFHEAPGSIFAANHGMEDNKLVIRVQPNESIEFNVLNKEPGLDMRLENVSLNLLYHTTFEDGIIPDAYERLLLDVMRGDRSLFIRADELEAAWDIVTPVLHELEEKKIKPRHYTYGSSGPELRH